MKLKGILSLMLCAAFVTVGGVYATWNFSTYSVQTYTGNIATVSITGIDDSEESLALNVDTSTLCAVIDEGNQHGIPVLQLSGEVVITLADSSVDPARLNLKYSVTGAKDSSGNPIESLYYGDPIFTFTEIKNKALTLDNSNGRWVIPASDLSSAVTINSGRVQGNSIEEYNQIKNNLPEKLFHITISGTVY